MSQINSNGRDFIEYIHMNKLCVRKEQLASKHQALFNIFDMNKDCTLLLLMQIIQAAIFIQFISTMSFSMLKYQYDEDKKAVLF